MQFLYNLICKIAQSNFPIIVRVRIIDPAYKNSDRIAHVTMRQENSDWKMDDIGIEGMPSLKASLRQYLNDDPLIAE